MRYAHRRNKGCATNKAWHISLRKSLDKVVLVLFLLKKMLKVEIKNPRILLNFVSESSLKKHKGNVTQVSTVKI